MNAEYWDANGPSEHPTDEEKIHWIKRRWENTGQEWRDIPGANYHTDMPVVLAMLSKQRKINELQSGTINRWVPCPDHRDKTVPGVCMLCAMARVLAAMERSQARRCFSHSEGDKIISFAVDVAREALGREPASKA